MFGKYFWYFLKEKWSSKKPDERECEFENGYLNHKKIYRQNKY